MLEKLKQLFSKKQNLHNNDSAISPKDEKSKSSEYRKLVEQIAKSIASYSPSSESESATLKIKEFKDLVALVALNKKYFPKFLDVIARLANNFFVDTQKLDCSAADAWFLWKHARHNRINFHYVTELPEKEHRLLSLAKAAIAHTNRVVFRGGDNDLTEKKYSVDQSMVDGPRRKIANEIRKMTAKNGDLYQIQDELEELLSANFAEEAHLGNCSEKCAVALKFLSSCKPADFQAEICHILDGDHSFIVLGRKPGSDQADYTTWGPDAVVCDPWTKQCYFARQIPERLKNFKPSEKALEPYHPHRHGLYVSVDIAGIKKAKVILDKLEESKSKPTSHESLSSNMLVSSETNTLMDVKLSKIIPVSSIILSSDSSMHQENPERLTTSIPGTDNPSTLNQTTTLTTLSQLESTTPTTIPSAITFSKNSSFDGSNNFFNKASTTINTTASDNISVATITKQSTGLTVDK